MCEKRDLILHVGVSDRLAIVRCAGVLGSPNSWDGINGTLPNLTFCTPRDPGRIGGHKPTWVRIRL